ncbi:MAG: hypothetical protein ABI645_10670 [Pseudomonadota bacterium]
MMMNSFSKRAAMLAAALATATVAWAQSPTPPQTGLAAEASPMFQRHHAMAGIMKDMQQEMSRMQEDMSRGDVSPEMAAKMKRMSQVMLRMSGWADRPTMKEPEMRRLAEEMHKQMQEMSKSPSMKH